MYTWFKGQMLRIMTFKCNVYIRVSKYHEIDRAILAIGHHPQTNVSWMLCTIYVGVFLQYYGQKYWGKESGMGNSKGPALHLHDVCVSTLANDTHRGVYVYKMQRSIYTSNIYSARVICLYINIHLADHRKHPPFHLPSHATQRLWNAPNANKSIKIRHRYQPRHSNTKLMVRLCGVRN